MKSLKLIIPHSLPQDEALARIRHLITNLEHDQKDKISDIDEHWHNETCKFRFSALGYKVSGVLSVHRSTIELHAKVPFAVFLFRNKIKALISEKAEELLST